MSHPSDFYFAKGFVKGFGKMWFLRVPQLAYPGSGSEQLLGSLVVEGDYGRFNTRVFPHPENSYILGIISKVMADDMGYSESERVNNISVAGAMIKSHVQKKKSGGINLPLPALPVGVGVSIDYASLRETEVKLGDSTEKRLIPRDLLRETYKHMAKNSDSYADILFHNDRMVVDQILLSKDFSVNVKAERDISRELDLQIASIKNSKLGIKFSKQSNSEYTYHVKSENPYLIAVSGTQADKFID